LKKLFDFLLFSSIYIAVCAVVMCYSTFLIFNLRVNVPFLYFVFFATLCSYNFHWYFTFSGNSSSKKVRWSFRNKKLHVVFFFISGLLTLFFAFSLKQHWDWLLITAVFTFLYSAPKIPHKSVAVLKKIAVAKTIFLALTWTHVTAILPVIFSNSPWQPGFEVFAVNRFFLIYPICILFDYRDRHQDLKDGIRSMITHFTDRGVDVVFWGSLVSFLITTTILYLLGIPFLIGFALFVPGVILAFLYGPSKKNAADYRYYFVLDGLMMLSGLLLLPLAIL